MVQIRNKLDHQALGVQVCCQTWPPSARWSSLLLFLTIKCSGFKILSPVWWCFKLWTIKSKCRHFLYNKLAIWDKIYFGNLNIRWKPFNVVNGYLKRALSPQWKVKVKKYRYVLEYPWEQFPSILNISDSKKVNQWGGSKKIKKQVVKITLLWCRYFFLMQ